MTSNTRTMSRGRFRAFLILVSVIALLEMLPRVSAAGLLVGRVVGIDTYGRSIPLGWANITVYANGIPVQSVSPKFDGSYSIPLPPGPYTVTAEHYGFTAQIKTVEIFNGRSSLLDFYMQPAPTVTGKAFEFSLSSGGPITIPAGKSALTTIQVNLHSGSPQIVKLSVSGLPSGASASFSSLFGSPSFTSICTIMTSPTTPIGSYTVTLIGVGGGMTHSISLTLTIAPPSYSPDQP